MIKDTSAFRERYNRWKAGELIYSAGKILPLYKDGKENEYYDYMEKLADKKAKEWGYNSTDEALTDMLNDNTYNYRVFYENDPKEALKMLTADPEAHFDDSGKTVYHPTFSKYSLYSGKVSDYNPRGTIGGSWGDNYYMPSVSQLINRDFDYTKTLRYLKLADPTYTIKMPKKK